MQVYYDAQKKRLETEYRDWLIDSGHLKEKQKEKSCSSISNKSGMKNSTIRSFSALEIDWWPRRKRWTFIYCKFLLPFVCENKNIYYLLNWIFLKMWWLHSDWLTLFYFCYWTKSIFICMFLLWNLNSWINLFFLPFVMESKCLYCVREWRARLWNAKNTCHNVFVGFFIHYFLPFFSLLLLFCFFSGYARCAWFASMLMNVCWVDAAAAESLSFAYPAKRNDYLEERLRPTERNKPRCRSKTW